MEKTDNILIVDDDPGIRRLLVDYLARNGFSALAARDGREMWQMLERHVVDLVVLDLMLPDTDGLTLCRDLRGKTATSTMPVLMLTARGEETDRIIGIEMGADDYLVKPFALSELAARIEAVLRRSLGGGKRLLQVGDLSYDLDTLEIVRGGKPLKLNPVGLKLLALLMQKSPHVVRREVLEEALWGDDCPDSDSLRSHVHQLRQVLDKPFPTPLLHTIHGVGYRLAENPDAV